MRLLLPPAPLDPVDCATGTAVSAIPQSPLPVPRYSRSSSCAVLPFGGTLSNTAASLPLASLPLAVPFPAKCIFPECLTLGVQSIPRCQRCSTHCRNYKTSGHPPPCATTNRRVSIECEGRKDVGSSLRRVRDPKQLTIWQGHSRP